ncbi:MAG: hypothetical protein AAF743_15500, partial [Planctomycetota bacterium]
MPTVPPEPIRRLMVAPALTDIAEAVEAGQDVAASGLWGSSTAALVAALRNRDIPTLVICGHGDEADDLADDVALFANSPRPDVLPALSMSGSLGSASEELVADRLQTVMRWHGGKGTCAIAPIPAIMQQVPDEATLKHLHFRVADGMELEIEKLIVWLADHGYNRLDAVEVPGDFAVRGGIVDLYLPGEQRLPNGDEVIGL